MDAKIRPGNGSWSVKISQPRYGRRMRDGVQGASERGAWGDDGRRGGLTTVYSWSVTAASWDQHDQA